MRLSTVFELLLIFLFLAFAASRTIHEKKGSKLSAKQSASQNRYCQCTNLMCNCCRDFSLPVVSLKGPGCAAVAYLNEDSMRLTMTFGDKVLRNITLAGKRPNPVCMPLPGGVSKFCGRVYGITRDGDHFKACLALELRSLEDLEAALRVSCFRFGPEGVKLEPGRPVPAPPAQEEDEDDDDDYGFSDDDDDDDDDDFGLSDDDDEDDDDDDGAENDVDGGDADYTGFSALSDEFLEGFFGSSGSKKPTKTTTKAPQVVKVTKKPVKKVPSPTAKPVTKVTTPAVQEATKPVSSTTAKAMETTEKSVQVEMMTSTDMAMDDTQNANSAGESEVDSTTMNNQNMNIGQEAVKEDESEEEDDDDDDDDSSSDESASVIEIINKGQENESDNKESNNILNDVEKGEGRTYEEGSQGQQGSGRGENISPEETERLFPGLTALIRPPSYSSYSFPPVRSARTHRRMRLPPIQA